jgi:hypothetical protein
MISLTELSLRCNIFSPLFHAQYYIVVPLTFRKSTNTVSFINTEGIELFQIGRDKTGSYTYDTVHIKDNNSIAVSSAGGYHICIVIIDIESQKVMITISLDTYIYDMAVRGTTIC